MKLLLTLITVLVATSVGAAQSLVVNGSFETAVGPGGSPRTLLDSNGVVDVFSNSTWLARVPGPGLGGLQSTFAIVAGSTALAPAPVNGSMLFTIGSYGSGAGVLWQDFATTNGQTYDVAYYFGRANGFDNSENVSVRAYTYNIVSGVVSGSALFTGDSGYAPATGASSTLNLLTFQFTALGGTSRLMFQDTSTALTPNNQLYLDGVSIAAIPEPSTYAAIAGVAMLGFAAWRRRRVA